MPGKNKMEAIQTSSFEFEFKEVGDTGGFVGLGSVFGTPDRGGDIVMPGAFSKSIEKARTTNKWPKMLWQHDPTKVIGVYETMKETSEGLEVQGRILRETALGNDAHVLMKNNALDGLSIGYITRDFDRDENGFRKLLDVELMEVSVVTFPMHPDALVSSVKQLETVRDVEHVLREAGISANFAKLVAAYGFEEAKARLTDHREGDKPDDDEAELEALKRELKRRKDLFNA